MSVTIEHVTQLRIGSQYTRREMTEVGGIGHRDFNDFLCENCLNGVDMLSS